MNTNTVIVIVVWATLAYVLTSALIVTRFVAAVKKPGETPAYRLTLFAAAFLFWIPGLLVVLVWSIVNAWYRAVLTDEEEDESSM